MDGKSIGNIGRYLNHSCNPNVFVQNVFVDTHDMRWVVRVAVTLARFPWIAFFSSSFVRAGGELCWDYNYEVRDTAGRATTWSMAPATCLLPPISSHLSSATCPATYILPPVSYHLSPATCHLPPVSCLLPPAT